MRDDWDDPTAELRKQFRREAEFRAWFYGRLTWYAIAVAAIAAFAYFAV